MKKITKRQLAIRALKDSIAQVDQQKNACVFVSYGLFDLVRCYTGYLFPMPNAPHDVYRTKDCEKTPVLIDWELEKNGLACYTRADHLASVKTGGIFQR